ncbi:MAG: choice-of-anchor B family protein [Bacteroidia bacterium]
MKKIFNLISGLLFFTQINGQVNLQLLGQLPFPGTTCAGVWHYVDSIGNEYALVGAGNGIAIVDVTAPATPVLLFTVPAAQSLWRELKTHNHYCYAGTEGGGGITIINLQYLPDSVQYKTWMGDSTITGQLSSSHTVGIADGYLYVYGSNLFNGGAIIADIATDPWNPHYVGNYSLNYIHDGYVRNDTLWAGEILAGQFSVVDVTNKSAPVLLATQTTPGAFCHNTWLSDNGKYLFTTDEVNGAPLGSFDISDLANIKMVDTYFTNLIPGSPVHNTHVINDYLVNPSYGSQITIVDALHPDNLIEIASYPTGTSLCWEAIPYLPSGNIIATTINDGLYIFSPYYVRACYLEGIVTDSVTALPINTATVLIQSTTISTLSALTGEYKTGIPDSGTYTVTVSKTGYFPKTITGVVLTTGNVTQLDVKLLSLTFGIENVFNEENLFEVIPNPFNSSFNLLLKGPFFSENTFMEIIDIAGKVIEQIPLAGIEKINLGGKLNTGIYFIRLYDGNFKSRPVKIAKVY